MARITWSASSVRLLVAEHGTEGARVVEDRPALHQLHAGDLAVLDQHPRRTPGRDQLDPFGLGLLQFPAEGGHLVPRLEAGHGDALGAGTQRGQGHVDGHVAAAHDDDPVAYRHVLAVTDVGQELHAPQHVGVLGVLELDLAAHLRAHAQEDGVVAVGLERLDGHGTRDAGPSRPRHPAPERDAGLDLDPQRRDGADLLVEHRVGQPVGGDAVAQHAARLGPGLEDGHGVALLAQVEGRGQPGRTRPDDGHPAAGVGRLGGDGPGGLGRQHAAAGRVARRRRPAALRRPRSA